MVLCASRARSPMRFMRGSALRNRRVLQPLSLGFFHLGADLHASMPTTGLPQEASEILARLRSRPSFLMVGTMEPRKGHQQALAAMEQLWTDGVDVNLVIVGQAGLEY